MRNVGVSVAILCLATMHPLVQTRPNFYLVETNDGKVSLVQTEGTQDTNSNDKFSPKEKGYNTNNEDLTDYMLEEGDYMLGEGDYMNMPEPLYEYHEGVPY